MLQLVNGKCFTQQEHLGKIHTATFIDAKPTATTAAAAAATTAAITASLPVCGMLVCSMLV
jgi:hypothetical protein